MANDVWVFGNFNGKLVVRGTQTPKQALGDDGIGTVTVDEHVLCTHGDFAVRCLRPCGELGLVKGELCLKVGKHNGTVKDPVKR